MGRRDILNTLANQITILRILLIFPFVICMLSINDLRRGDWMRYGAVVIFAVMGMSDAVDGYMARKRRQVSRLGTFLDPLADKLLMTCACILLAVKATSVPGYRLPGVLVVLIIGKDVLLTLGFLIAYILTNEVRIKPMIVGKLSTFFQLLMVSCVLLSPEIAEWIKGWPHFIHLLWMITGGLAIAATAIYIWKGIDYIESFERDTGNE